MLHLLFVALPAVIVVNVVAVIAIAASSGAGVNIFREAAAKLL